MAGPLLLARHWPLATRCRISGRRNPVRPSELDPQGRSRRPVSDAGCPSTSSEAAGGALLRFTPRPRSAPRSAARFPLAGASVPVSAIESCEHRKWTCTAGGDLQPDLRHRAARSPPPSGPRRTTSRSPSLTPRSKKPAPSCALLCVDTPAAAAWSPLPCRNRLPFLCRSQARDVASASVIKLVLKRLVWTRMAVNVGGSPGQPGPLSRSMVRAVLKVYQSQSTLDRVRGLPATNT